MFATSFCFWGLWAPVYALTAELAPRRAMGVAFGVLNSVAFTASLVAPFVTGWIKDWSGSFAGGCYLAALLGVAAVPVALAVRSPELGRS
jgi:MFS family permease